MKNIELAKSQIAARVLESILKMLDERTVTGLIESAWQQLRGQKAEHADCTLDKETLQQLLWLHNEAGGWITEEANEGGFLVNTVFVPTFEWVKKHGPLPQHSGEVKWREENGEWEWDCEAALRNGEWQAEIRGQHPWLAVFAQEAGRFFTEHGGANFVQIDTFDDTTKLALTVTVQKRFGMNPGEKLRRMMTEIVEPLTRASFNLLQFHNDRETKLYGVCNFCQKKTYAPAFVHPSEHHHPDCPYGKAIEWWERENTHANQTAQSADTATATPSR